MNETAYFWVAFLGCLLLSWYLYRKYYEGSSLEDRISSLVDSGSKFGFGLVALIIIPLVMISSGYQTSVMLVSLYVGIGLLFNGNLRVVGAGLIAVTVVSWFTSAFYVLEPFNLIIPAAATIEPFPLVIVGAILFQSGFGKMNEFQLMRNIPRSKIRSVAVGPVEISGTIMSKNVLTAPYSKSPCVYYRTEEDVCVEIEVPDGTNTGGMTQEEDWRKMRGPAFKVPFWVKDETGEIMVDPEGAEVKISDREFGELNEDGTQKSADDMYSPDSSPKVGEKRYVEQFLAPNDTVFILGTAALRKDETGERLVIQEGANAPFVISESPQAHEVGQQKWDMVAGLSYGILIFLVGFFGVLYMTNLL